MESSWLDSAWLGFASHFSEYSLICVGTFVVYLSVWVVTNVPYLLIDQFKIFQRYKIQKNHPNDMAEVWAHWWRSVATQSLALPACLLAWPLFAFCNFQTGHLPTWQVFVAQFIFFNLLEDFLFYWTHRLLHLAWFFKHVHYVHHKYHAPFSVAGAQAHPFELVFNFLMPTIAPPLLCGWYMGVHVLTLWLWLFYRELRATEAHSGYILPWHLAHVLKFVGYLGSGAHDLHHSRVRVNFGSFVFWDLICGTYEPAVSLDGAETKPTERRN